MLFVVVVVVVVSVLVVLGLGPVSSTAYHSPNCSKNNFLLSLFSVQLNIILQVWYGMKLN